MRPTSSPIRYVFFDAGGTLIDLDPAHVLDILSACGEPERSITAEALAVAEDEARAWFMGEMRRAGAPADAWAEFFTRLLRRAGAGEEAIPGLLLKIWRRNLTGGLWHRPVPGAIAALARLKAAGLRLAVISNAEGRVAEDLAIAGLAPHFETIVDSHKVGVAKPDPRIFAIALERLGASAEESIYVGDLYRIDVLGARAAGLRAVLLDRFGHQSDADCTRITHLDELGAHLFTD